MLNAERLPHFTQIFLVLSHELGGRIQVLSQGRNGGAYKKFEFLIDSAVLDIEETIHSILGSIAEVPHHIVCRLDTVDGRQLLFYIIKRLLVRIPCKRGVEGFQCSCFFCLAGAQAGKNRGNRVILSLIHI